MGQQPSTTITIGSYSKGVKRNAAAAKAAGIAAEAATGW